MRIAPARVLVALLLLLLGAAATSSSVISSPEDNQNAAYEAYMRKLLQTNVMLKGQLAPLRHVLRNSTHRLAQHLRPLVDSRSCVKPSKMERRNDNPLHTYSPAPPTCCLSAVSLCTETDTG